MHCHSFRDTGILNLFIFNHSTRSNNQTNAARIQSWQSPSIFSPIEVSFLTMTLPTLSKTTQASGGFTKAQCFDHWALSGCKARGEAGDVGHAPGGELDGWRCLRGLHGRGDRCRGGRARGGSAPWKGGSRGRVGRGSPGAPQPPGPERPGKDGGDGGWGPSTPALSAQTPFETA